MAREFMQKKEAEEKRDAMFAHLRELSEALDDSWKGNQRMIRRAAWSVGMLWVVIVLGFVIDLARGFEVYLHH
jgi:hypothetical protein